MKLKDKLRKIKLLKKIKNAYDIKHSFYNDRVLFSKNWIESEENDTKRGYNIILLVHSLEKGMTSKEPRCFGFEKIKTIVDKLEKYNKSNIDFAYILGVNCLRSYCEFYENNGWNDRDEYIYTKDLLKKYQDIKTIPVGSHEIYLNEFIEDSKIDYNKFLKSRHSVRNFKSEQISDDDFLKAVSITLNTPTACNRQMCKIYYIKDKEKRDKAIKFGNGLTNFQLENTNLIIVTYDISSFCFLGDRNQGWFNAGLVSMNFVNSLHSLGIGSCFIQFGNEYDSEKELKELLNISSSEKIAVIIAAGYYDDVSIIPYSTRKEVKDISKII